MLNTQLLIPVILLTSSVDVFVLLTGFEPGLFILQRQHSTPRLQGACAYGILVSLGYKDNLDLMINAGMLLASSRRLIFGGHVIALGLTWKSYCCIRSAAGQCFGPIIVPSVHFRAFLEFWKIS